MMKMAEYRSAEMYATDDVLSSSPRASPGQSLKHFDCHCGAMQPCTRASGLCEELMNAGVTSCMYLHRTTHAFMRASRGTRGLRTICKEALDHGVSVVGLLHAERVDGSTAAPHGCHLSEVPLLLEQVVRLCQAPKPA